MSALVTRSLICTTYTFLFILQHPILLFLFYLHFALFIAALYPITCILLTFCIYLKSREIIFLQSLFKILMYTFHSEYVYPQKYQLYFYSH